mmetsp:Transcript_17945/g.61169  ORF Transcript_17945/g.61169 Transcript_17945/m.61169 type:complete len:321 (+) Transcript_17945:1682-2644(+)
MGTLLRHRLCASGHARPIQHVEHHGLEVRELELDAAAHKGEEMRLALLYTNQTHALRAEAELFLHLLHQPSKGVIRVESVRRNHILENFHRAICTWQRLADVLIVMQHAAQLRVALRDPPHIQQRAPVLLLIPRPGDPYHYRAHALELLCEFAVLASQKVLRLSMFHIRPVGLQYAGGLLQARLLLRRADDTVARLLPRRCRSCFRPRGDCCAPRGARLWLGARDPAPLAALLLVLGRNQPRRALRCRLLGFLLHRKLPRRWKTRWGGGRQSLLRRGLGLCTLYSLLQRIPLLHLLLRPLLWPRQHGFLLFDLLLRCGII